MNREDIIRLAREAGLKIGTNISGVQLVGSPAPAPLNLAHLTVDELERFADLAYAAGAAAEREACAKSFEEQSDQPFYGRHVAAAIRARSEI